MVIKVKKTHVDAVIPQKTYTSDFCYDVTAVSEEEIAPNVWKYGLGLAFQIERGTEHIYTDYGDDSLPDIKIELDWSPLNLSIDFRPRSSVWKTGMVLSNCVGTVDEDYTGEVSAVFYHVMPNLSRYKVGDRIGQIKLGVTFPIKFIEVQKLNKTERASNGYGSTGM